MKKTLKKGATKQARSIDDRKVPPVYFSSLEVENVLCFKDRQVLELFDHQGQPAQWTVILGDNGVGKTTLLRCLAGMESRRSLRISRHDGNQSDEVGLPCLHNLEFIESWTAMWQQVTAPNASVYIRANICHGDNLSKLQQSIQPLDNADKTNKITYSGMAGTGGPPKANPNQWETVGGLICYGYGAIRNLGHTALDESLASRNSLSLFSENVALINAEEWLLQTDYAYRTAAGEMQAKLQHQLTQIFEILKRILPDINDIRIAPVDEFNPRPRAEFQTPYGWVHINSLGLGYRTAIAWMVDLAVRLFQRYPNSPDPLSEPAIVLIDEIDLHLHPRWQRTIMDFLTERFPNTQFIVTAHSPLVVQAAQTANIVLLRREGDRVVIDNNPETIENWRVDQVLTSVFELPTSRASHLDPLIKRREELLAKSDLTGKDEAELQKLAAQIGALPTAETAQDIEAMDIIRRAARLLEKA